MFTQNNGHNTSIYGILRYNRSDGELQHFV